MVELQQNLVVILIDAMIWNDEIKKCVLNFTDFVTYRGAFETDNGEILWRRGGGGGVHCVRGDC